MNEYLRSVLENTSSIDEDAELYDTSELYDGVEEEVEMRYNAQTVPIKRISENEYAIKFEDLTSVVEFHKITDGDSNHAITLSKIAKVNGIEESTICVIIPSKEEMDAFTEACYKEQKGCSTATGKEKAKCKVKKTKKAILELKDRGVKIKKSK